MYKNKNTMESKHLEHFSGSGKNGKSDKYGPENSIIRKSTLENRRFRLFCSDK